MIAGLFHGVCAVLHRGVSCPVVPGSVETASSRLSNGTGGTKLLTVIVHGERADSLFLVLRVFSATDLLTFSCLLGFSFAFAVFVTSLRTPVRPSPRVAGSTFVTRPKDTRGFFLLPRFGCRLLFGPDAALVGLACARWLSEQDMYQQTGVPLNCQLITDLFFAERGDLVFLCSHDRNPASLSTTADG
jgi:hypothetical protein